MNSIWKKNALSLAYHGTDGKITKKGFSNIVRNPDTTAILKFAESMEVLTGLTFDYAESSEMNTLTKN